MTKNEFIAFVVDGFITPAEALRTRILYDAHAYGLPYLDLMLQARHRLRRDSLET